MTEECRARQFWQAQRRTSYTAWKRCRDAYAVYVGSVERQCKEEPIGPMGAVALERECIGIKILITRGVLPRMPCTAIPNRVDLVHRAVLPCKTWVLRN